jgi:hypothetical protein
MEWIIVGVIVAAVVIAGGLAAMWWMADNRSRTQLKNKFGREYDVAEGEFGDRKRAEKELRAREERVEGLRLRPLSDQARERYTGQWKDTQARFVDNPSSAIREADTLVQDVMRDRGYPAEEFSQREADLSVNYPDLVSNYRSAHQIALKNENDEADTEEQRKAVIHYRSVFEELLANREAADAPTNDPVGAGSVSPRISARDR